MKGQRGKLWKRECVHRRVRRDRGETKGYSAVVERDESTLLQAPAPPLDQVHEQYGGGDGQHYQTQQNDDGKGAQANDRVKLVLDPVEELGMPRLGLVCEKGQKDHVTTLGPRSSGVAGTDI